MGLACRLERVGVHVCGWACMQVGEGHRRHVCVGGRECGRACIHVEWVGMQAGVYGERAVVGRQAGMDGERMGVPKGVSAREWVRS